MNPMLLIIITATIVVVIVASTVGTMEYQKTYNQNCNSDGGKIVGFLRCIYINEDFDVPKTASDCRKIFGKGTTEMYDCLEKIEKVEGPSVGNDVINAEPERTPPPLDKFTLFEDPLFTDPDKFVEISEKKDSKCFTTPSMNYFCYAKPRMYESGIGVSWLISDTTKISGELHFDNVNVGPSYFTMKNMTLIKGDTAKITFADKDYRVGNSTSTLYEITNDFEFTTIIEKFDTFIAKCDNYEGTSVTVVQYLGITTIDGVDYFMTWHLNAHSEDGIACDYPQIIQNSFDNDFGNIGREGSASYYPNKRPLPNGTFDDNLENVIPWLMMQELETHGIENWKNDPSTRAHTDEGWLNPSKMCSSLFVDGETKLYISTSFYSEPELTVSEIIIDDSKPMDCQKWFWIPYGVDSKTGNLLYGYDEKSPREYYEIEITGLKDVYIVGERYDFSYIISGYGNSCGSKTVTFPDSNGDTIGSASSASCIANLPMGIFVFDIQKEQGTTYGHVEMKNPGTYTVTVTFDKPSKYFPTTVSKEFRVTEK